MSLMLLLKICSNLLIIILFASCAQTSIKSKDFDIFLHEPCMIVNFEQDNTIEGQYLKVDSIVSDTLIYVSLPSDFAINDSCISNWIVGWGQNIPLFDSGVENLRCIKSIDIKSGKIILGDLMRGKGFPQIGQRVVFWNENPSGFVNKYQKNIINTRIWNEFSGKSVSFSSVQFDSSINKWVIIVNECDTSAVQLYAAVSDDLLNWEPANMGNPILRPSDFANCRWAGTDIDNKIPQTPYASDFFEYNGKWYLFLDGYSKEGRRCIGLAISKSTALGPYEIFPDPIIEPSKPLGWNNDAVYYAKVEKYKDGFIMFYDGQNKSGIERVGIAYSKDLLHWENSNYNPILDQHTGWRSAEGCTEPAYVEIRNDTIFLLAIGMKKFKMGFWNHYVTRRMYLDVSGNVDDAQLGFYFSVDDGKTFVPHKNNPVFTNNYANKYENEHIGGNFELIKTDTADIIIYQAKTTFEGPGYSILLRSRKK